VTVRGAISKGVTEAAARGWDPISANFLMPAWVKSHWPKYVEGCERGGRAAEPANWRVAKSVLVAKDAATAKAYATESKWTVHLLLSLVVHQAEINGRIELFKTRRDQPDDEVTLEMICDKLIIYGTPESVADQLLAFQNEVGQFGTLLYAGKDWRTRAWTPVHDLDGGKVCRELTQALRSNPPRGIVRSNSRRSVPWLLPIAFPIRRKVDRPRTEAAGCKKLAVWSSSTSRSGGSKTRCREPC